MTTDTSTVRTGRQGMKKKSRRLHYLAVLIVFLTFVAREVLHEHWRELADSIERAEQEIEIRGDVSRNYAELRQIEDTTMEIFRDVVDVGDEQRKIKSQIAGTSKPENRFETALSESLHQMNTATDVLQSLATEIVLARTKLQSVGPLTRQISNTREDERIAISRERELILKKCFKEYNQPCRDGLDEITDRTNKFISTILDEADKKRDIYGTLSNIFGWLGIVLFTGGSVIAMFTDEKAG